MEIHSHEMLTTPERVTALDRLGDEIAELSAHVEAATARLLDLIREFDARGGWNTGFRSCAAWRSWRVGLDLGAAREKVCVARALGTLPLLAQALGRGELSYAKVRALTRVATPETEARLLGVGRAGTASHVERIVRGWRRVDRKAEARETARQHTSRALHVVVDADRDARPARCERDDLPALAFGEVEFLLRPVAHLQPAGAQVEDSRPLRRGSGLTFLTHSVRIGTIVAASARTAGICPRPLFPGRGGLEIRSRRFIGTNQHQRREPWKQAEEQLPTNVYRVDGKTGQMTVATGDINRPNGLAFSPDEVYDVVDGGTRLSNKRKFLDPGPGTPDGYRCDVDGNLWCGWGMGQEGLDGVSIFNPDSKPIGRIDLPERCANLCFGGTHRNRLFMAASTSIYSLYVNTQGVPGG